jgi:hypothetical protein
MRNRFFIFALLITTAFVTPLFSQSQSHYSRTRSASVPSDYYEGYHMGQLDAGSGVWWGVSSFVAGCCVGGIMPYNSGLLIPAASLAGASIPLIAAAVSKPEPSMHLIRYESPDFIRGYSDGYTKAKKSKSITAAVIGTGASVVIAVGAMIYAPTVIDYYYEDGYKANITEPHNLKLTLPIVGINFSF